MKNAMHAARVPLLAAILFGALVCLSACGGGGGGIDSPGGPVDHVDVSGNDQESSGQVTFRNASGNPSNIVEVYGIMTYTGQPVSERITIRPGRSSVPYRLEAGQQYEFNCVFEDGTGPRRIEPRPVVNPGETKTITFYW